MARRARHFNPVHAGAGYAIDARYLTGYSNGANVTSWVSRPGVSVTFSESSNYPTFSSSVTAAANQPGVSFTSGSNHRLFASSSVVPTGSSTFTYIEYATSGSGFVTFAQASGQTRIGCLFSSPGYDIVFHRGYFDYLNTGNAQNVLDEGVNTTGVVAWGRLSGTTQESKAGTAALISRTASGTVRGSSPGSPFDFRTGVHHASAVFNTALSDSLLRRIVDHYAFSFKSAI
jgi:hypothetical protein